MPILRQHKGVLKPDGESAPENIVFGLRPGADVPYGWTEWNDANGRYLIGTDDDLQVGTVAAETLDDTNAVVFEGGAHNGPVTDNIKSYGNWLNSGDPLGNPRYDTSLQGAHDHNVTSASMVPPRTSMKLVKAGSTAQMSKDLVGFSTGTLSAHELVTYWDSGSALLKAESVESGYQEGQLTITTSSTDDAHNHREGKNGTKTSNVFCEYDVIGSGGAPHSHVMDYTGSFFNDLYRIAMKAYGILDAYDITGLIGMWISDDAIPSGWELVATADERYLMVHSTIGDGSVYGDGTVSILGSTDEIGHDHYTEDITQQYANGYGVPHTQIKTHYHDVSLASAVATLDRFYVKFIRRTS